MIISKKVILSLISVFLLLSGTLLPAALPATPAKAATEVKRYLVLAEEKDGTWSTYDNFITVKSNDKLMVKASAIAKAIGIKYKKKDTKSFTLSNVKKVNTYTKGTVVYKYNNGSKSVIKKSLYKPYTSDTYKANMIEYNTLSTLVNVKYYSGAEAGDYNNKWNYQGVLCFSKYNKISALPPIEEGTRVTSKAELEKAVADLEVSIINIDADIIFTEDFTSDRPDSEITINIKKGKTLTINKAFLVIGGSIINNGIISVSGNFERGICIFTNNGSIIINKGGMTTAGMSDWNNNGTFTVNNGAELYIERGSQFANNGNLNNEGRIIIDNGGSLNNRDGELVNNGTIDLYTYFDGDISLITGSGILNDYREVATE